MTPQARRAKELRSVVLMQKWVRGHLTRIYYSKQRAINFKEMRRLRRLLSVAYGRIRQKMVKQITSILRESGALHQDENYKLWQQYKGHCALLLQKHWRGYSTRFLKIDEVNNKVWGCKRSRMITAAVKGLKTRLLLHPQGYNKALHQIR